MGLISVVDVKRCNNRRGWRWRAYRLTESSIHHTDMSINSELKKVCKLTDLTVDEILSISESEMEDFIDMDSDEILIVLEDNGWEYPEDVACVAGYYGHEL